MGSLILQLMILIIMYICPLVIYLKTLNFNSNNLLKKVAIVISYILLYFIAPPMYANLIPFLIIILIIGNWKKSNLSILEYEKYNFSVSNFKFRKGLKYVAITYIMIYIVACISMIIFSKLNIPMERQEIVSILDEYSLITFLISVPFTVIFAPVVEEFCFRYIIFQKLLRDKSHRKIPFFICAFLVSLLFAGVHESLSAFPMLFVISFVNCYLLEKKGFWYAVFVHLFVNGVSMMSLLIGKFI